MLQYKRNGRLRFLRIGRLQLSWCIISRSTYARQRLAAERTRLARMVSPHYLRLLPMLIAAVMLCWPHSGQAANRTMSQHVLICPKIAGTLQVLTPKGTQKSAMDLAPRGFGYDPTQGYVRVFGEDGGTEDMRIIRIDAGNGIVQFVGVSSHSAEGFATMVYSWHLSVGYISVTMDMLSLDPANAHIKAWTVGMFNSHCNTGGK